MNIKRLLAVFGICLGVSFNCVRNFPTRVLAFEETGVQFYHDIELDTGTLTVGTNYSMRFESNGVDYYGMSYSQEYNGSVFYYALKYYTNSSFTSSNYAWTSLLVQSTGVGWVNNAYRFIELIDATSTNQSNLTYILGFTRGNFRLLTGWYTFNSYIPPNTLFTDSIYINFTSNGVYYTHLEVLNDSITYDITTVYTNSKWINNNYRLLYFERGYISEVDYNILASFGSFTYNDINPDYTMSDLIFSFVDIPLITLSSLLSFEVFGVDLFIALGSLLLVLVVFKIVKLFI